MRKLLMQLVAVVTTLFAAMHGPVRANEGEDNEERADSSLVVQLARSEIESVDKTVEGWRQGFEAGRLSADEYYTRLASVLPRKLDPTWKEKLERWTKERPDSFAARYLLGLFHMNYGWQLRGERFASGTTERQFQSMSEQLELAERALLASTRLSRKPFPAYVTLIRVSRGLQLNKEEAFFRQAEAIDPSSFWSKRVYMTGLAPKWGGSIAALDWFAQSLRAPPLSPENLARLRAEAIAEKADDLALQEQYAAAAEQFRLAYRANPTPQSLGMLVRAANTAKKGGLVDQAIALYSEVIEIDPKHVSARSSRAYLLETEKKNLPAAKDDLFVAAEGGSGWALNRLGWWYLTGNGVDKDLGAARAYFERAVARGNANARANLEALRKTEAAKK